MSPEKIIPLTQLLKIQTHDLPQLLTKFDFQGDVQKAAQLLDAFAQAAHETLGHFHYPQPVDVVFTDNEDEQGRVGASTEVPQISFGTIFLEAISSLSPDRKYWFHNGFGEAILHGTPGELAATTGWEEGHHLCHMDVENYDNTIPDSATYHSQPMEMGALMWRLEQARLNNFSKEAIKSLETELKKAQKQANHRR